MGLVSEAIFEGAMREPKDYSLADFFIAEGANLSKVNEMGYTPLMMSILISRDMKLAVKLFDALPSDKHRKYAIQRREKKVSEASKSRARKEELGKRDAAAMTLLK